MIELAKKEPLGIKQYFKQPAVEAKFKELLGARSQAFVTSVLQAVSSNPDLLQADPASVYNSAAVAAVLNLPINQSLGHAYIVPYNVKQKDGTWAKMAQFQLGYKGLIQLGMRSGQFIRLNATDVREGELINRNRLTGEMTFEWENNDAVRSAKKVVGFMSYFKLINGFESEFYMSKEEMEGHAKKYSQTYKKNFGKWADDFDKMALKTVIKLNLNSGKAPLSIEMEKAITVDQAIIKDDSGEEVEYADHEVVKIDAELERFSAHLQACKSLDDIDILVTSFDAELPAELMEKVESKRKEVSK
jgi:recombination protein RecT